MVSVAQSPHVMWLQGVNCEIRTTLTKTPWVQWRSSVFQIFFSVHSRFCFSCQRELKEATVSALSNFGSQKYFLRASTRVEEKSLIILNCYIMLYLYLTEWENRIGNSKLQAFEKDSACGRNVWPLTNFCVNIWLNFRFSSAPPVFIPSVWIVTSSSTILSTHAQDVQAQGLSSQEPQRNLTTRGETSKEVHHKRWNIKGTSKEPHHKRWNINGTSKDSHHKRWNIKGTSPKEVKHQRDITTRGETSK